MCWRPADASLGVASRLLAQGPTKYVDISSNILEVDRLKTANYVVLAIKKQETSNVHFSAARQCSQRLLSGLDL